VTVIEVAPRLLSRVCDEETSALIHERHRERGVDIRLGAVVATTNATVGRFAVVLAGGGTVEADLIAVGAGAVAEDRLAQAAGLATQGGIIVDDHCRTSDPTIFAAGDCTRPPGPHGHLRLENWRHGQEHGAVAGRNAAGGDVPYNTAPSFWSEQFDMYIQGVGWPPAQASARVRREIGAGATLLFELDGQQIAYAVGINAQRDIAVARRLIERRVPVDAGELADAAKPLAQLLKAKA
jgi:NADPH-dependent 2,4-dienoyl-CoA reductase/sulfur reductase-like enzyme